MSRGPKRVHRGWWIINRQTKMPLNHHFGEHMIYYRKADAHAYLPVELRDRYKVVRCRIESIDTLLNNIGSHSRDGAGE